MARRSSEVPPLSRRRQREEQGLPPFPIPFAIHGLPWFVRLGFLLLAAICLALATVGVLIQGMDALWIALLFGFWGLGFATAAATARSAVLHEDHVTVSRFFRRQTLRYSAVRAIRRGASETRDVTLEPFEGRKLTFLLMDNPTHQRVVLSWLEGRIAGAAFD